MKIYKEKAGLISNESTRICLHDCHIDTFWQLIKNRITMKLIGLVGYKESGKDTVLKCILELLPNKNIVRHNFADPLKQEIASALGITVGDIESSKRSYRTLLQVWGSDIRRNLFGNDYWVIKWGNKLLELKPEPDVVIATDVRFVNEAEIIHNCGGKLVMVRRPGKTSDGHESEQLEGIHCDYILQNDQSIQNLKYQLEILLPNIM